MKVLAINSSSRNDETSKTKLILSHLVKGMKKAGADVEIIDLRSKNIKNCIGCMSCWTKTPGKCILNDDMTNEIFPKLNDADIVIYATPLFCHHMNAVMSAFLERRLPALMPFFERERDRTTHHPKRFEPPKAVWLSVCGFPDISEFDLFSNYVHYTFKNYLIAEIYRSAAESMTDECYEVKLKDILSATEKAGEEIVRTQKIQPETLKRIIQPIENSDTITKKINQQWNDCLEAIKK